jgi:hypothetical protein
MARLIDLNNMTRGDLIETINILQTRLDDLDREEYEKQLWGNVVEVIQDYLNDTGNTICVKILGDGSRACGEIYGLEDLEQFTREVGCITIRR